jgi:NADH-quinone oxidoreductase subunit G
VSTDAGTITLPALVTEMPDHVVWLPTNAVGSAVRETLRAVGGDLVRVGAGAVPTPLQTPEHGTAEEVVR